ncbi:SDR family oxidoreductase [Geomonas sp.]|uniref:SDR family oxidoreductase n=1 Tax=Geomonas sp. TaxID=2651584 RepID=UPI002B45FA34|nr:SDR family oxidoreductase [Geomonas sp.]HJV35461.1 SDR family oxidoreductase [Geomonas sp.]
MTPSGKRETIVVTGASAGLGRAIAHAFAREGARIGLIARDRERLETVKREVEELGGSALPLVADVASPEQVEHAASQVEDQFGPIDIWVNNAMTSVFASFKDISAEEFKRVTEVTYLGTVYGTSAALSRMLPRDQGVIVQVGSALADRSIPLQSAYCGAKHGIRGFTDSIRCELRHDKSKVHLTMVQMPALNTPQFSWVKSRLPNKPQPVPPIFQPEVAADAVIWAAHHRRRELYVGMSTVKAMWGNRFIPGLLDRYLSGKGYDAQQTDQPERKDRPDNLWHPVPGPYGTHGEFDARARDKSPELWMTERKWWGVGLAAAGVAAAAAFMVGKRRLRVTNPSSP